MTTGQAKVRMDREQMAAIAAQRLQPGWIVNLGSGIPTLASSFLDFSSGVVLTSENGVIGYGILAPEGEEDLDVVNASAQFVSLNAGASILGHADSFALIRSGKVDCTVLGAYEVAADGSFANWKTSNDGFSNLGGIGGAMDLAACAKHVYLVMSHTTRTGEPRLIERCTLPLTGPAGTVGLVITDIAILRPTGAAFELLEMASGWTVAEIQAVTGAPVVVTGAVKTMG